MSSLPLYGRTLANAALWLGVVPLWLRLLGRLGARRALHRAERAWAQGVRRALHLQLTIEGLEHVNLRQTYLITPLHEGLADPVALLHLPLPLRFAVRDEFLSWHLLGPALKDTRQIFVCPERGAWSYRRLLRAARQAFAEGESVVVFPQGSILGVEIDFTRGAFQLARALDCPILPVALTGSHCVWEHPYSPHLRYGQHMSLRVLPPVPIEEIRARSPEKVRCCLQRRLKAEAMDGMMAPPRHFVPERDGYWDGYSYRIDPAFEELATEIAERRAATAT